MAKYMATIGVFLLVALAPFAAAQEDEFSLTVDEELMRVHLKTGGQTHMVLYSKGSLQIRVNTITYPARFGMAEGAKYQEWLKATNAGIEIVKDADDEKAVVVLSDLAFSADEPAPNTTRGKALAAGEQPMELKAQLKTTLRIKKGLACVFVKYEVINQGVDFQLYRLPWLSGGPSYSVPGADGPEQKQYKGQYAAVSRGEIPWVFSRWNETSGMGVIFPDYKKIYIGEYGTKNSKSGSIYLNTIPQKVILKSGETVTCEIILVESASPQELAELYKKVITAAE